MKKISAVIVLLITSVTPVYGEELNCPYGVGANTNITTGVTTLFCETLNVKTFVPDEVVGEPQRDLPYKTGGVNYGAVENVPFPEKITETKTVTDDVNVTTITSDTATVTTDIPTATSASTTFESLYAQVMALLTQILALIAKLNG